MRIRLAAALSTVSLLALSACGSDLSPDIHPGSAAVIGEHKISISEVDTLSDAYCTSALPGLRANNVELAMSVIRSEYIRVMSEEAIAHQYADAHDLDVKADFRGRLDMIDQALASEDPSVGAPKELRPALRDYNSRRAYVGSVEAAVGRAELEKGGNKEPLSQEAVQALGKKEIDAWAAAEGVQPEIDPRFDLDGKGTNAVSYALSAPAKMATDTDPDPEKYQAFLDSLPASQKCG